MNNKRDYRDYINDILSEINSIKEFTKDLSFEEFSSDKKTVYAVIRSFEVIGEAVKNLPEEIRDTYPDIPWKKMSGMRDKLIHEYFGVSLPILWQTVKNRIPELEILIKPLFFEDT